MQRQCLCDYKSFRELDIIVQLSLACKKLRYPKRLADDTIAVLQFEITNLMTYNFIRIADVDATAIFVCKNDTDDSLRFFRLTDNNKHLLKDWHCYPFFYKKLILLGSSRT